MSGKIKCMLRLNLPPRLFYTLLLPLLIIILLGDIWISWQILNSITPPLPSPIPETSLAPTPSPLPTTLPSPSPNATLNVAPKATRSAVKPPPPKTFNYTSEDLWQALATYRSSHNRYQFIKDDRLCSVAADRVAQLIKLGKLDKHQGFKDRFASDNAFKEVGFGKVAENLAFGFETAVAVIEWGWDSSTEGHREAQLTSDYTHACTATSQSFSVLILGFEPL